MQEYYTKDGEIYNVRLGIDKGDGTTIYNASEEEMRAMGFEPYKAAPYVEPREVTIMNEISELKEQLASSDYKIIKCMEARLMNREMPYEYAVLINERNGVRDQINDLEEELELIMQGDEEE